MAKANDMDAKNVVPVPVPLVVSRDPSADFADKAHLTYLIPSHTNLELETALKGLEDGKSVEDCIEQRDSLFFGQSLHSTYPLMLTLQQTRLSTSCSYSSHPSWTKSR